MSFYSKKSYWDGRYQWVSDDEIVDEVFDWYVPYAVPMVMQQGFAPQLGIREEILACLPPAASRASMKVLVVGCGISLMPEQLCDDGFGDVTGVDFSDVCIRRMERRKEILEEGSRARRTPGNRDGLKYLCAPCEDLSGNFAVGTVDLVIDKGMLDAAFCDSDVNCQHERVAKIVEAIYEVIRDGGVFLHVTPLKDTAGPRGVLFRNPVAPWTSINAAKIELPRAATSDGSSPPNSEPQAAATQAAVDGELERPYWLFRFVK